MEDTKLSMRTCPAKFMRSIIEQAQRYTPTAEKAVKLCTTKQERYARAYNFYVREYSDGRYE